MKIRKINDTLRNINVVLHELLKYQQNLNPVIFLKKSQDIHKYFDKYINVYTDAIVTRDRTILDLSSIIGELPFRTTTVFTFYCKMQTICYGIHITRIILFL